MINNKNNDITIKTASKTKNIKLLKVPKFVSNKWLQHKDKDIVGLLDINNEDICSLYIQKDESDDVKKLKCNKNKIVNTYILKQNKIYFNDSTDNTTTTTDINTTTTTTTTTTTSNNNNKNVTNTSNNNASNKSNENIIQNKINTNINNSDENNNEQGDKEKNSILCTNIIKCCDNTYAFLPTLDADYSSVLKERHYKTNVKKDRYTIIETRNEEHIDSTHTLFKYYTPDDITNNINTNTTNNNNNNTTNNNNNNNTTNNNNNNKNIKSGKRTYDEINNFNTNSDTNKNINTYIINSNNSYNNINTSSSNMNNTSVMPVITSKYKMKQSKKMNVIDLDKTKISMFKMFENEGKKGVPFSLFTKNFNIPTNYIKNILEEIAVKRKRPTDKKPVYFLKD
ncbi:transcription initiation factor IIF subunit beta, putative [Hepatocystis sp. ex Piliocolobus tephrosceles]|nr:transcription initiation factor IIF subunit beta, putative [Hepatocystis sp. ex Piliocolobus tephrosceles]